MDKLLVLLSLLFGAAVTSAVIACGGGDDKQVRLGDQTFTEKGTKDASGMASLEIEAGDFYFEPTFVRGAAGQKLKLQVTRLQHPAQHQCPGPAHRQGHRRQ
jgi:hypothetical protein